MRIRATLTCTALALLPAGVGAEPLFATGDSCLACHNGLTTPSGREVSMGYDWRASMMANSARDPYWQASVRRETLDHPGAARAVEDECAVCHMPMSSHGTRAAGGRGAVFAHLASAGRSDRRGQLARDGVSCALCHQVEPDGLGSAASFTGGFVVASRRRGRARRVHGPYSVEPGLRRVMRSATGFEPARGAHVQRSALCATCHTLYTHARGADGRVVGRLPEQVPYLEWRHSAYRARRSCQSCHMPRVGQPVPVASVLGDPRQGLSRHVFRGGNFLMPRMLLRHRSELGVAALPQELVTVSRRTAAHLRTSTATVAIQGPRQRGDTVELEVTVRNLAGHKLPTAYPSRRVWLHVTVRDRRGEILLESGHLDPDGTIRGNDNDIDAARFERHRALIRSPDQVQIYEAIMVDPQGRVTTGLLRGVRYIKDNRVLPRGFDKASAGADIRVRGRAAGDPNFGGGTDTVRYRAPRSTAGGPYRVVVELLYQPIAHRWADNLAGYEAAEPRRFWGYYREAAPSSALVLARARASWRPPGEENRDNGGRPGEEKGR